MKKFFLNTSHVLLPLVFFLTISTPIHAQLPPGAQVALDKGIVAAKLPDYPLAIKYFNDARKLAPDAPIIYFNLGLAESKMPGRELRAICWFGAYLAADPKAPNAAAVLDEIKTLEVKNQSNFQRIVQSMEDVAKNAPPDSKGDFWHQVTQLWIKSGSMADAIRASDQATGFYRGMSTGEVVDGLIESGDLDQAEIIARPLSDPIPGIKVIIARAEAKIRASDQRAAQSLLMEASVAIDKISGPPDKMKFLAEIARVQSSAADKDGVKITLTALRAVSEKWDADLISISKYSQTPGSDRVQNLVLLATSYTQAGDLLAARDAIGSAHKIAETIPPRKSDTDYDGRSHSLSEISKAEAAVGDLPAALKTADSITYYYYKWLVLNEVARLQAKAGNATQARKTIDLLAADWPKSDGLTQVAEEQLKASDRKGALETLQAALQPYLAKKEDPGGSTEAMAAIADVQYRAGDISAARNTLAAAQKLCDRIPDNKAGGIHEENSNRKHAQYSIDKVLGKIGRTDSPASPWVFYNDASTDYDDAPLNAPLFMDFSNYWKSLLKDGDQSHVFFMLSFNAERLIRAQRTIDDLEKQRLKRP